MKKASKYFEKWILVRVLLCIIIIAIPTYHIINSVGADITITVNFSSDNILVERWGNFSMYYDIGNGINEDAPLFGERKTIFFGQQRSNKSSVSVTPDLFSALQALRLDIDGIEPRFELTLESLEIKKPLSRIVSIAFADIIKHDMSINDIQVEVIGNNVYVTVTSIDPFLIFDTNEIRNATDTVSMRTGAALILTAAAIACLLVVLIPDSVYCKIGKKVAMVLKSIVTNLGVITLQEVMFLFCVVILCFMHYYGINRPDLPNDNNKVILAALAIVAFIAVWTKMNRRKLPEYFPESSVTTVNSRYYYLTLFVLSAIIYFPTIFINPYFYNDEWQGMETAIGFLESGRFVEWDFITNAPGGDYPAAWPYHLMIAGFFYLFGVSTASAKAVGAICGIVFIMSVYFVFNKMTKNRSLAFLTAVLLLFHPSIIDIFRVIRMYVIMLPATVWMVYFAYNALTKTHDFRRNNKVTTFVKKYIDFHYGYLLLTVFMVVFNYINMPNALFTGVGIILFILYKCLTTKETKYKVITSFMVAALIIVVSVIVLRLTVLRGMTLWEPLLHLIWHAGLNTDSFMLNYAYMWMNIAHPWGYLLGALFLFVGIYIGWRYRKSNDTLLFFSLIQISTVLFFIFVANRYVQDRYMAFLYPFTMLLIVSGVMYLFYSLGRFAKVTGGIILTISMLISVNSLLPQFYTDSSWRPRYTIAVETIRQDALREKLEVVPISGSVGRTFYTRNAGEDNVIWYGLGRGAQGGHPETDILLRRLEITGNIGYVFYETNEGFRRHPSINFRNFLLSNTNIIFDDDNLVVFKYTFISPEVSELSSDNDISFTYEVGDPIEKNGEIFHPVHIRMLYDESTPTALFQSVRIIEFIRGHTRYHYVQLLIPEGFTPDQELIFEIPLRTVYGESEIIEVVPLNYYFGNGVFYPELSG